MTHKPSIAVIGAGMVGTCCALHLQNEGYDVTLIDRNGPGEAASSGNLGCFGIASCVPAAMPGVIKKVPAMLLNPKAPLKLRWAHAPKALPWFLRFIAASRRDRVEAIAKARQTLLNRAHDGIDPLVADADAKHLLSQTGLLFTFESEEAYQGASYAFELRRQNGVKMDLLDGNEARQIEPMLTPNVVRGIRVANLTHTVDPLRLVQALAALFERRGGRLVHRSVRGFDIGPDGVRAIRTDDGALDVDNVVIAAGVWSRPLAGQLGTPVPLEAERGYHTMFHGADMPMHGAVLSVDRYISVTPMMDGIRAGGVAEFAAPDAAANFVHARMVRRQAEALFPTLKSQSISEWMGPRPSHPDSKPVIGRSPRHKNAFFAFGHDHLGLTMGGITGKLISELVSGKTPCVDLEPFRPDRF
ncbi:MAG: FAD-binding oxidoreductase [Alphaproteobacteria bacterium]|nr:FAD-binding oxidoreductase [Alphaproteobacteria bacterium]